MSIERGPLARRALSIALVAFGALLASCATSQGRFAPLGRPYPPRPEDCSVAVLGKGAPQAPFERIARLDVHIESTGFSQGNFEAALPELKKQACLSGADAIVDIEERSSGFRFENRAYHVTATGIKYKP